MTFRANSKHFSVTYAQCDLSPEDFIEAFKSLHGQHEVAFRAASELHEDGGLHWHVAVKFANKFDLRNANAWDIDGFHPNIQASRNYAEWFKYISKDGVHFDVGDPAPKLTNKTKWADIVASGDRSEFMEAVRLGAPRDYVLCHERLEYYASSQYAQVAAPYVSDPGLVFRPTGQMNEWKDQINVGG